MIVYIITGSDWDKHPVGKHTQIVNYLEDEGIIYRTVYEDDTPAEEVETQIYFDREDDLLVFKLRFGL